MKKVIFFAFVLSAMLLAPSVAFAVSEMEPASILLFPYISSDRAKTTIISVTNVNTDPIFDPFAGELKGSVIIHYYYVDGDDCDITDRRAYLTPGDTFCVMSRIHNPSQKHGWLYVVAENAMRQPCKFDGVDSEGYPTGLVGDAMVADFLTNFLWAIPAIGIKAGPFPFKANTDINGNGFMDFGPEYEALPKTLYISSFIEQGFGDITSELVLLSFVLDIPGTVDGGANADVRVDLDFLFYNNDEVEFSQETEMRCWMVRSLKEIFNGSDNLGGAPALVPTGWASVEVENGVDTASGANIAPENLPILGLLAQRVTSSTFSSARLLHRSPAEGASCVIGSLDIE